MEVVPAKTVEETPVDVTPTAAGPAMTVEAMPVEVTLAEAALACASGADPDEPVTSVDVPGQVYCGAEPGPKPPHGGGPAKVDDGERRDRPRRKETKEEKARVRALQADFWELRYFLEATGDAKCAEDYVKRFFSEGHRDGDNIERLICELQVRINDRAS